jgi:hypothetical protein
LNDSVCTGRPIADIHNGEGEAGAKHDLDARKHTSPSKPPAAREMIVHNGAGARWDAQSWMICTMDIANTAPIKPRLVGDPA